ncbi:hypothetical protein JCM30471_02080 [Desulfuromonas carbonis]
MAERIAVFASLRFKFALLLALFSGALMLAVMLLMEQNIRSSLVRENIEKGLGIARGVAFNAEDPLLTGDDLYLFSAVKNAVRGSGIEYALIVDRKGRIRAAADMARVGTDFTLPGEARLLPVEGSYVVRRVGNGAGLLDLEVPIYSVADRPVRLGDIHLGLSEALVAAEIEAMRQRLGVLAGVALVLGSLAAYLLAGVSLRPVHALVRGVRAIGGGNLEQHLDLKRNDELGVLTDAFNEMASSLREKEFIKNTFERYVSKPLAETILRHRDDLKLGGEEKEVTILFCDIRRFTSLAERLPPAQVVELLNDYFTLMIQLVIDHEGMVDKLMGDSVMALFGAPLSLGNDPLRAVHCAIEMQRAVRNFNQERAAQDLPPLEMGIGINTGPVIAGNIGSATRMEYTVIGDSVNIAARLQGLARPGEILVSEGTYRTIREQLVAEALPPIELKGKRIPVGVYRVESLRPG